jgi:hypothetical protein
MTATRSLAIGLAMLAALAAAAIIALSSAPPADAHGSCSTVAREPTKNTSTAKIRGYADYVCTDNHTYVNIQVCLQKEVNGQWFDTGVCELNTASSTAFIDGWGRHDCTSASHGGKYRTRAFGFTGQTPGSAEGHQSRDWSTSRTFSCP